MKKSRSGFTIVELLIVIVVIAILAMITLVVYSGVQAKTRDAVRQNDLSQIAGALNLYNLDHHNYIQHGSGYGVNGNGNGWLNAVIGSYPLSIISSLQADGILKPGTFTDPSGCLYDSGGKCGSWNGTPVTAYMKASCTKDGKPVTYLFAHLETKPRIDAEVDALCDAGTIEDFTVDTGKWGTHYGMNYYVKL